MKTKKPAKRAFVVQARHDVTFESEDNDVVFLFETREEAADAGETVFTALEDMDCEGDEVFNARVETWHGVLSSPVYDESMPWDVDSFIFIARYISFTA